MKKFKLKKMAVIAVCGLTAAFLFGCSGRTADKLTEKITEFYYTYDNINFNAHYQRYHFYLENNEPMFYHETRDVENGYGPATEENITKSGTVKLTADEWDKFLSFIKKGTVKARGENADSGDSGPWLYLYWEGDKGKYQEFSFDDWNDLGSFEAFCEELAAE